MTYIELFLIAFGLSMDAVAVSICNSLCYQKYDKKEVVGSAFSFGMFQGIMPIIGFLLGQQFIDVISALDHWIALVLLVVIGGKMLYDAFIAGDECNCEESMGFKTLLMQSVATSIDALAIGISLAALNVNIWVAAAAIAIITFLNSAIGGALGKRFGALLGNRAQMMGGLILVAIGLKIFIEHMFL